MNGLLVAEQCSRLDPLRRHRLAGFLRTLPINLDDETANQAWTTTMGLAERFALSAYDAAYLELAQRRSLPLATLDGDLRAAAAALGLTVLGS
jgi:predicted nucleic acid-binding protein